MSTELWHVYQRRNGKLVADDTLSGPIVALAAARHWRRQHSTLDGDLLHVHPIRRGGEYVYHCDGNDGTRVTLLDWLDSQSRPAR